MNTGGNGTVHLASSVYMGHSRLGPSQSMIRMIVGLFVFRICDDISLIAQRVDLKILHSPRNRTLLERENKCISAN